MRLFHIQGAGGIVVSEYKLERVIGHISSLLFFSPLNSARKAGDKGQPAMLAYL